MQNKKIPSCEGQRREAIQKLDWLNCFALLAKTRFVSLYSPKREQNSYGRSMFSCVPPACASFVAVSNFVSSSMYCL